MRKNLFWTPLLLAFGLSAIAGAGNATAPVVDTPALSPGPALEEVVVTALRREQNIQDLGVSIAELSGEQIRDLRMTQPVDIARATPGLVAVNATSDSTPIFAVRGVGLDDFNINNSSGVGVYSDEVFASSPAFLTGPLFDIERIEVLKGPQGTLYGRNATGGAINIISRQPTRDWSGEANTSYSRWGLAQFDGGVGGPLGERMSFRVAGALDTQHEGWQRDTDTGQELGKLRRGGLRLQLKAELTPDVDLLLNLHAARDRSTPESPQSPNAEEAATSCCGLVPDPPNYFGTPIGGLLNGSGDPTQVRVGPIAPFTRANTQGGSASLTARFDEFTVTSITAFDRNTTRGLDNYDGLPVAEFDFYRHFAAKQFSEELRIASTGERRIDWIGGIAYSQDEVHGQDALDGSFTVLAALENGLIVLDADYLQKTESVGLFAHGEAHLNDRLSFILGLRYSHDKVSFDGTTSDSTGLYLGGAPGDTVAALDDSVANDNGTFVTGLNYHLNDRVMLYGTVSSGYKGGVYYGLAAVTPEAWGYTKPERVTNFEVGMKARGFDDRLQLNGAVFHADYRDRQSSVTVSSPFIFSTLANIPRSRIEGAELELSAKPGGGFEFQSAIAYLDTQITRTTTEVRGLPFLAPIPNGTELPHSPRWTFNVLARHEGTLGSGMTLTEQLSYNRMNEATTVLGDPNAVYGPVDSLGARISLGFGRWNVALWGENLADDDAVTYGFTNSLTERLNYLQKPRSYGLTIGYTL
jgi:iron complex outermembrane receptor protein